MLPIIDLIVINWKTDLLPGKCFSAGEGQIGMGGFVHYKPGKGNRIFDGCDAGNCAASPLCPVHNAGFHFNGSFLR